MKPDAAGGSNSHVSCVVTGLVGCGVVGLLLLMLGGTGVYFGVRAFTGAVNDFAKPFEQQGYRRVTAQVHTATETVDEPTVFVLQVLKLENGADADIAIAGQYAEIHGTVDGDIDFWGQALEIKADAVIKGDIRAKTAQVIRVTGKVEGQITGNYQQLVQADGKSIDLVEGSETGAQAAETETQAATSDQ